MGFKGRLISKKNKDDKIIVDPDIRTGEGSFSYAVATNSIIRFESTISGIIVEFKGFITEMSDKFQSNWETEEVYGRMDPIGTFKNTVRTISLGWTIPAVSIKEAKSNFEALRSLTSMLYPGYSAPAVAVGTGDNNPDIVTGNSLSKPPLIRLSYANLIRSANNDGLLGWVDGFDITPTMEMGFFVVGTNQYPKVYTMSCNFNVLHEHDLGWQKSTEEGDEVSWISPNPSKFPFGEN